MNGIQGKKPSIIQWNIFLGEVVKIMIHKKIMVDNDICIKVSHDGTVSYLKVSTDDVLNNNNNKTSCN